LQLQTPRFEHCCKGKSGASADKKRFPIKARAASQLLIVARIDTAAQRLGCEAFGVLFESRFINTCHIVQEKA
jgi:hypothetical protein